MEPSPLEISDLRLRIRTLRFRPLVRQLEEIPYIVGQMQALGSDAQPLVPDLLAAMRAGVRIVSMHLVPLIAKLKSPDLLEALVAQDSLNTLEKCELLKAGFSRFERPLLDELSACFERDDSSRCEIVEALAESDTTESDPKAVLETLEVIEYRIASRIPELRAELLGRDPAAQAPSEIMRHEFCRWQEEFLQEVRRAIPRIRERPDRPSASLPATTTSACGGIGELRLQPESDKLEFKAALRSDHTGAFDGKLERHNMQAIAAFANANGGTMIVGIEDKTRKVVGLAKDYALLRGDRDAFERHLRQRVQSHFGKAFSASNVKTSFLQEDGAVICRVEVEPATEPLFLKTAGKDEFYVRNGNANVMVEGEEFVKYLKKRFPHHH